MQNNLTAGVTQKKFAALCGKSEPWVDAKRHAGLIPQYKDGTIPLEEGLAAVRDILKAESTTTVTISRFAALCQKSSYWVKELVETGVIPQWENGNIPLEEGMAVVRELSLKEKRGKKAGQTVIAKIEQDEEAKSSAAKTTGDVPKQYGQLKRYEPIEIPENMAAIAKMYDKARAEDKAYQAKIRELNFKQREGELVERAAVEADAAAVASEIRSRLVSVAVRVAGRCEGRTAREIEGIIEDSINEALESLQRSEFCKKEDD